MCVLVLDFENISIKRILRLVIFLLLTGCTCTTVAVLACILSVYLENLQNFLLWFVQSVILLTSLYLQHCLHAWLYRVRGQEVFISTTTFKERRTHVIAMMHTRKWLSEGMFGSPRSTLVSEPITLNGDACLAHLSSAQHKMRDFRLQWLAKMTVSGKLKHRALKWAMVDSTDGTQCFCTVYDPLQPSNCSEGDLWPP